MDRQLKQRVVGAALLVAGGVIFIPIFLDNGAVESPVPATMNIPPAPTEDVSKRVPPLSDAAIDELESRADEDVELPLPRTAGSAGDRTAAVATPAPRTATEAAAPAPATAARAAPAASEPAPNTLVEPAPIAHKPTPAAALATPAPASSAGWSVQLGSFASDVNAGHLADKLHSVGLKAYVERHIEAGTSVFKVRVGPESGRDAAERLRQRIEQQFAVKGMLVPFR